MMTINLRPPRPPGTVVDLRAWRIKQAEAYFAQLCDCGHPVGKHVGYPADHDQVLDWEDWSPTRCQVAGCQCSRAFGE